MAFIPVPEVALVRMVYLHLAETAINTFHVHSDLGWSGDDLLDVAAAFLTWHDTRLQQLQSTATQLLRVEAIDQTTQGGRGVQVDCSAGCVGTLAASPAPGNVTACVTWTTGLTGRSNRGRTYHVGLTDETTNGNLILEATRVSLEAAYFDLISDVVTANPEWSLSVVSRFTNNAPRVEGVHNKIENATVDPFLDSMRTRLPGRGI